MKRIFITMEVDLDLPLNLPAMTLADVAFFPQALLPLRVFEPRYRRMLDDVLKGNRVLAVAGLNADADEAAGRLEPPHRVAGVGLVRACQTNVDGTSNILVQGLCRVEIVEILAESPYRRVRIRPLESEPGAPVSENRRLRAELARLIGMRLKLGDDSEDFGVFLKTIRDPDMFVDIAVYNLCGNAAVKQRLLETLDVHHRLELFTRHLRTEIDGLLLRREMQDGLPDDRVGEN